MRWRPFSKRGSEPDADAYDALHDHIPDWLKASVWNWIDGVIVDTCNTDDRHTMLLHGYDTNEERRRNLMLTLERELRLTLPWNRGVAGAVEALMNQSVSDPKVGLDVLDFLLNLLSNCDARY